MIFRDAQKGSGDMVQMDITRSNVSNMVGRKAGLSAWVSLMLACFWDGLERLVRFHPTHSAGFASSVMALGWAIAISFGWEVRGPTMLHVLALFPKWGLVSFLLLLGVTHGLFTVMIRTNRHVFDGRYLLHVHRLLSVSAFALWAYLTFVALLIAPAGLGLILYGVLACASLWEFLRTGE